MRRFLQSAHFLGLIFSMTGVFCLFLGASSRLTAEEKDADDTSCRDIGDIFCLLEEFSASLDYSFGFSAKIGPGPNLPKSLPQRTIIDLQHDRTEMKLSPDKAELPTEIKLINLNPEVNVWYLLRLQWPSKKVEWFHLDNPNPGNLWLELNPLQAKGLWLRNGRGGDSLCELWNRELSNPLRSARQQNSPFVPICKQQLYVRNRSEGMRTTKEWVVEFLRANIWGGEAITNIVKETVYKDSFLIKSDPTGKAGSTVPEVKGPAAARIDGKSKGELLPTKELGLSLAGVPPEASLEVGRWYKTERQEGVFVSVIEPRAIDPDILKTNRDYVRDLDAIEKEAQSILVAFDTSKYDMHFAMGTDHPALGWSDRVIPEQRNPNIPGPDGFDSPEPLTNTGLIPPFMAERVVGIFTGGFKRDHGAFHWGDLAKKNQGSHYGFMENGVVFSSLQPDLASLIVYKDGRVDMKTWTDEDTQKLSSMRDVRQNGVPVIEWNELTKEAVPGKWVSNWTLGNWSGSQDKKFRTLRAGVCLAEHNNQRYVIYGYFSSMTPAAMARIFQAYGCRYAMHLDMNALEHTYMSLYAKNKAKDKSPQHLVKGMKVLDERVKGNVPRYIGYPDNRDFFYFVEKKSSTTP